MTNKAMVNFKDFLSLPAVIIDRFADKGFTEQEFADLAWIISGALVQKESKFETFTIPSIEAKDD